MFKRATWLGVGFTLGVGTTVVAARKARQQLDRYKPPALVDRVTTTIATKTVTLKDQVVEPSPKAAPPPKTAKKSSATKRPRHRPRARRPLLPPPPRSSSPARRKGGSRR